MCVCVCVCDSAVRVCYVFLFGGGRKCVWERWLVLCCVKHPHLVSPCPLSLSLSPSLCLPSSLLWGKKKFRELRISFKRRSINKQKSKIIWKRSKMSKKRRGWSKRQPRSVGRRLKPRPRLSNRKKKKNEFKKKKNNIFKKYKKQPKIKNVFIFWGGE